MSQASSLHSTRVTPANYPLAGTVFFDVAGLRRRLAPFLQGGWRGAI